MPAKTRISEENMCLIKLTIKQSSATERPNSQRRLFRINLTLLQKISIICSLILSVSASIFAQNAQHNENKADQTLRGSGRINPSTLAMEIDIPLGSYPGRGINVPISLSYSSKLWRMEYVGNAPGGIVTGGCRTVNEAKYSENSASGWTTSLATPYIEYVGLDNLYNSNGFPLNNDLCDPNDPPSFYENAYVRRLIIHLPGGETHELRADNTPEIYPPNSYCGPNPPFGTVCPANFPFDQANWDRTYYAVDGSNIKYIENSPTNTFKLLMPDGSYYTFATTTGPLIQATIRKAVSFTDRNGNFTSYDSQTGSWTDTLGKTISAPIGLSAPADPTPTGNPQVYSMPGMIGTYKFHWKKLENAMGENMGIGNLKYLGDKIPNGTTWNTRPAGSSLFVSNFEAYVKSGVIFNPVVLTEIELPTGQKYKFIYDIYGRIEKIYYPTGGEERFQYAVIAPLSGSLPDNVTDQANFGVVNRKVFKTAGQGTPYEWTYDVSYVEPMGYKVGITAPDNVRTERSLHRGNPPCGGCQTGNFGYDNGLAGMAYKEDVFSAPDVYQNRRLLSRKLTHWTVSSFPITNGTEPAHWHPRVDNEQTIIYDDAGNSIKSTTTFEYESGLGFIDSPVLVKRTKQFAFEVTTSNPESVPDPNEDPDPQPTPIPTPIPAAPPVKIIETTYLINDAVNYPDPAIRAIYKNQNMVGLTTVSVIRNGAETIVSRSETKYDETNYSPNVGRGNPTTIRVWDNTKGNWDNPAAYIQTKARFNHDGNQYEAIDAKGNVTTTEYDATHRAFPIKVTTAVPDPNPSQNPGGEAHGSQTAFVTEAAFDPITGLPLTIKDANGQVTTMQYDPVTLRPKKVIPPTGAGITETDYNDVPNDYWVKTKMQIETDKWVESITRYDGLGRAYLTEQTDSQGNIFVEKEFDAQGRVWRISNPYRNGEMKKWTTNVYDEVSRVKQITLQDGATIKTDYGISTSGVIGITKQITDQADKKRKGITDALGRMVRVIEDPGGQNLLTDYVFDTLGNLRKTTQGEQTRYFSYDTLGRLLRVKQPEQEVNSNLALATADAITGHNAWSVKYEYDDNGNIIKTTDAQNRYIEATYDKHNRLIFRNYSDTTPDVHFYYDGTGLPSVPAYSKGKTTRVASTVSETRYTEFDNLGRLLSSQQKTPFDIEAAVDTKARVSNYKYNLAGAVIEETYPSGRIVKYVLDNDGQLSMVQSRKKGTASFSNYAANFTYNSAGAVTKMQLGNGHWETAVYNERLQITQIGLGTTDSVQDLLKLEYSYGSVAQNNGSLREQKITVPTRGTSSPGFSAVQTYNYDNLNRLQSVDEKPSDYNQTQCTANPSQCWKQTFLYDRYGNREFNTAPGATTPLNPILPEKVTNPQINTSDNRFQKDQDGDLQTDYDYDKTGNLIRDAQGKQYFYDAEDHQKEVRNASGVTVGTYLYDGEGKRVKKITATETTVFVYNASKQLVAEYSTQVTPAAEARVSYLTQDHLGSPRIITDQNGSVLKRQDYTAFGEELFLAKRAENSEYMGEIDENQPTRRGYTGYEKDDESGLDFAQARYYNSSHGRFTSVDPLAGSATIKDPQTFNRYSYVLNSPYKFSDPLGLLPIGSYSNGACSAEYSSCEGESYDPWAGREEVPEQVVPEEGVADNQESESTGSQQEPVEPEPPPAPPDENNESAIPPQINVKGVKAVVRRSKRNARNELSVTETTLATGEASKVIGGPDFELNLNNAAGAVSIGEDVFLAVEFEIFERGDQNRASFDNAIVLKGVATISQPDDTVIKNDGKSMTAYFKVRVGRDGLSKGKIGAVTIRAQASFNDEYDSTTNKIAQTKPIKRDVRINLINSAPDPGSIFLKKN